MSEDNTKRGTSNPSKPPKQPNSSSETPDRQNNTSPSLASRIQSSATGLARNAFTTPGPPADIAHTLSTSSNKAAGSSSAPSASSSLSTADHYAQGSASSGNHPESLPSESFRSESTPQQGAFELPPLTEEEFQQHTYNGDFPNQDISTLGKEKGKGKAVESSFSLPNTYDDYSPSFTTAWNQSYNQPQNAHTQPSDGEAVLSILNSQSFDPEFPPTADEPFEPIETDLTPPALTPAEIQMIESFRRHLPQEPLSSQSPSQPHRLTSFSLVPDIGSILDNAPPNTETEATALRDTVLTNLPGAAEWVTVEERYHDEVWGFLRPTLEAAAKEMEAKQESGNGPVEDGPAVRRLKMILGHMKA